MSEGAPRSSTRPVWGASGASPALHGRLPRSEQWAAGALKLLHGSERGCGPWALGGVSAMPLPSPAPCSPPRPSGGALALSPPAPAPSAGVRPRHRPAGRGSRLTLPEGGVERTSSREAGEREQGRVSSRTAACALPALPTCQAHGVGQRGGPQARAQPAPAVARAQPGAGLSAQRQGGHSGLAAPPPACSRPAGPCGGRHSARALRPRTVWGPSASSTSRAGPPAS